MTGSGTTTNEGDSKRIISTQFLITIPVAQYTGIESDRYLETKNRDFDFGMQLLVLGPECSSFSGPCTSTCHVFNNNFTQHTPAFPLFSNAEPNCKIFKNVKAVSNDSSCVQLHFGLLITLTPVTE